MESKNNKLFVTALTLTMAGALGIGAYFLSAAVVFPVMSKAFGLGMTSSSIASASKVVGLMAGFGPLALLYGTLAYEKIKTKAGPLKLKSAK